MNDDVDDDDTGRASGRGNGYEDSPPPSPGSTDSPLKAASRMVEMAGSSKFTTFTCKQFCFISYFTYQCA